MQGPSLRQSECLLEDLGVEVAHSAIWYWLQRVGSHVRDRIVPKRKRGYLVVDETEVRTRDRWIFIFAAIDLENREIVHIHATKYRESVDVLGFLNRCLRYCEGKPVVATDGGP